MGFLFNQIGQIKLAGSREINITVQIDPRRELSAGRHFLTIPTYTMYDQRMADEATKTFVGSVDPVTVNFTVEGRSTGSCVMNLKGHCHAICINSKM